MSNFRCVVPQWSTPFKSSSSWMGIDMKWLTAKPNDKETNDSRIQIRAATTGLQSMPGNGVTEETLKLAQINAKTKFSATSSLDVQLPTDDPLKEPVQPLSKQPGIEWLNELSQRKDVN